MRRIVSIVGIGFLTATVLAVASPATAAPASDRLTVFIAQDQREVLDVGAAGTTVGDVVTGSGDVSRTKGGAATGSFVYRAETVRVDIPGGVENRLSTFWITLPKGSIAATSLISISQGTRPATLQTFVILGGTGAYAGAQGTMAMKPLGPDDYRLTYRFVD